MKRKWIATTTGAIVISSALAGGFAVAQNAPESLLPPGFDDPAPSPTPAPPPPPSTAQPVGSAPAAPVAAPVGPAVPLPPSPAETGPVELPPVPSISSEELAELPTLEQLEELSTDELDDLLGLKPQYDIPPAARRSLRQVGILGPDEGGFVTQSLALQPGSLVRATLAGTTRPLVSRWGHILLRRVLSSRLAAPESMSPVEFAALRAGVLNRIGEFSAARAIVQDVDTGNWDDLLTANAVDAYVASADFVGACPAVRLQGGAREDAQWVMLQAICNAYGGNTSLANAQLGDAVDDDVAPEIDIRLAQRYAGAAGRGRRAVTIEWEGVQSLNAWRFALANAVGEPIPERLLQNVDPVLARAGATSATVPLGMRAQFAQRAGREGILSSRAMVGLYSQIYADTGMTGEATDDAIRLREAYVASDPAERLAAMQALWEGSDDEDMFGAYVMTAYAAARFPPSASYAAEADQLIASMLTAGLDRDAAAWSAQVAPGSLGWALIAVSSPNSGSADSAALDQFVDSDTSADSQKSAFLVASLAGLGRIGASDRSAYSGSLDLGLDRQTRWTRVIARAAEVRNPTLVAMLVGLGMQGSDWDQMTPLHLFHITSALSQVGLSAEARMIAAEAVARG